jgi:hypothetical protein
MNKWIVLTVIILTSFIEYYFLKELNYCVNWGLQGLFFLIAALTLWIVLIMVSLNYLKGAFLISISGGILIVSYCVYNLTLLNHLKSECDKLIRLANNQKIKSGKYPSKLNCEIDTRIIYTKISDNDFNIFFYVTAKNSGHFYNPKESWVYMDD